MSEEELAVRRREYTAGGLDVGDLTEDPMTLLRQWLDDAISAGLYEPTAMVLATVSATGHPSVRTVLLKSLAPDGLVFFTNYSSHKGEDLAGQPACALVFPWHAIQRQVRVEGVARRLQDDENDAYFASRPRESQLGAWASPQSKVVPGRERLHDRYDEVEARFAGVEVPRPPYWGGYRVEVEVMEFWQGRRSRLHDRFRYRRARMDPAKPWHVERLAP